MIVDHVTKPSWNRVKWLISDTKFTCATEQFSNQDLLLSTQTYLCMPTKIQQTKMLVTCQRFGDLFLFGLVGLVGLFIINLHIKVHLCAKKKLSLERMLTPLHLSDSSNYNHSSFLSRKWLLITDTQTLWSRPCNDIGVCCPWTGLSFPLPSNLRSSQWSSFKQKGCW